eukprot:jgi/Ulvmu1/861/UM100_0012.1
MFIAAVSDSNGGTGVRLVCKTSEKVIPADVVARSEVLQEIRDERRQVKCDLNWSAACNWVSWDPWEDPGWPASEVCKALKVAEYMSDTELEALASIVAERVAAHVPATPISKPLSRSLSKVVSSFKSALGGRRKPAWNSERKASSGSLPPPVDASEDLLRAIELLPEHLIALVLRPYDMHAVLRIPTATPRPKLLLALQKPTLPSRASSSLPSGTDDADTCTPSDTSTTSALDPMTPPATSRPSHDLQQNTHMLPFAHIGSHAAAYLAIQLPALHTHLTPNNSPLAAPQSLLSLDLSHNNLASRTPNVTPFKTPLDALAAHLSALTALHSLNISFNSIAAADSVACLGAALRQLEWLQELNISHNLIDSDAAAKLALCLPAVTALTSLDISANRIGSLGAKAISAALFLPPDQLQRHPSHRGLPAASPSPQPSPSPPPPADSPAPADPADPDMLPESPTTPIPPAPENEVFSRAEGRSESPMELLDLSHNDIEPPGLLEVAVTFAQAGGRACHLSTLDLSYNCRAAHERLVRSLKSSASFSPQESAYARAYARIPAGDGLTLLPAGVLAEGGGYEGTGGVDMLEALIAMAPFLVAENLPALESLRMCVFVARGDAEMVSEESIMGTSHFQRERTAGESWGPPAPRWGMGAAPKGQHAASAAQPGGGGGGRGAASAHTRDGSGSSGPPCVRDGPGMELLGESLATFGGTLRRLDVRGLPLFAGEGARGIARGLGALTQLTSLDLSATDAGTALCGGGGLVAFSQLTGGPTDTESSGGDAAAAPALGPGTEFLTRLTALKRLDLSECGIDGDRVEHEVLEGFACHLSALADLEELNLAGNGLKGGLVVVMPHLAALSALRALSIADNRITAAHFARLGDGLAALSGLTRLDASANRLGGARRNGESAAGAVVDCLTQLTALQELHLSYNRLRQEDAAVLLPPLQALTVLRRVFLKQHGRLDALDAKTFLGDKEEYVV